MKERTEEEVSRLKAERWAKKRCSEEVSSALRVVGEASKNIKSWAIIPLRVDGELKGILLGDLVIRELKRRGFSIYYRQSDQEPKIKEYCLTWGFEKTKEPEGFIPVE